MPEKSEQTQLLERMVKSLEALEKAGTGGNSAGSRAQAASKKEESSLLVRAQKRVADVAKGRAFGGGLAGAGASFGLAAGVGAAGLVGQGLVAASQGGTFGGGVARAGLGALASVPILGELSGAAPADRIASGTESDLNALTNNVARFAGPLNPKVRETLAANFAQQNKNIEADRQANTAATNGQLGNITQGQGGIPELIAKLGQLLDFLSGQSNNGANHRT